MSVESEIIWKIIPMDSKGEQDGNVWFTTDRMTAMRAFVNGHKIFISFVSFDPTEF